MKRIEEKKSTKKKENVDNASNFNLSKQKLDAFKKRFEETQLYLQKQSPISINLNLDRERV